jgi:hypothetical protein
MLHLRLIILSGRYVLVDSETLVTNFMNLNIKLTQSFECVYRDRVCVPVCL